MVSTNQATSLLNNVIYAIENNMNTPTVLSEINLWLDSNEETLKILYRLDKVFLKIDLFDFSDFQEKVDISAEVTTLADQRVQAKHDKNYALADELRNKIVTLGFQLKDTKDGYEITKI